MSKRLIHFLVWLLSLSVFIGSVQGQEKGLPKSKEEIAEKQDNPSDTERRVTVKVDIGRIRWQPSLLSPVKFRKNRGDGASIVEKKGDWYLVRFEDGNTGWAHESVVSEVLQEPGTGEGNQKSGVSGYEEPTRMTSQPEKEMVKTEIRIKSDNDLMSVNFLNVDIREALSALS